MMKNDESRQAEFNTEENIAMYNEKFAINIAFAAILAIFSTYFVANEAIQFWGQGVEYFSSFWNYIDILPPALIYLSIFISFSSGGSDE